MWGKVGGYMQVGSEGQIDDNLGVGHGQGFAGSGWSLLPEE